MTGLMLPICSSQSLSSFCCDVWDLYLRIHKRLTLLYYNLYSVPLCLLARSSLKHVRISTEETCKLPLKCSYIVSILFLSFLTWTKVECEYCGIINWCELYFPSAQGTRAVPHKPLIYTLQMKNVVTRRQATSHFLQLKVLKANWAGCSIPWRI